MNTNIHPAIVVVAFNREISFRRILDSLARAQYHTPVTLILSIDNNGKNRHIAEVAYDFEWKHGEKRVIYHPEHLGLRKHVLSCGDLVYEFGSILVLEEDIFVSPVFYDYACKVTEFYRHDKRIAGVSLYTLPYVEGRKQLFIPLNDSSDVFFIQTAGSIGQVWNVDQWTAFRKWYDLKPDLADIRGMSQIIKEWPSHSWKKYFVGYMIVHDKYFVFPKKSYVTNFSDGGTNMITKTYFLQVPVQLQKTNYAFVAMDDSSAVYDAYTEILPDRINRMTQTLQKYDYDVDLYGQKDYFSKPLILTTRKCKNPILGFDRNMKPHEMNIIMDIQGSAISLAKKENVLMRPKTTGEKLEDLNYFYKPMNISSDLLKIILWRFFRRIKKIFR